MNNRERLCVRILLWLARTFYGTGPLADELKSLCTHISVDMDTSMRSEQELRTACRSRNAR